ncbi:hypothetical protein N431DRAFT_475364 [Stipitochalara longipes BDJ]|nr:hypothetical protein N431DRAFT_475364 [Stipitochalara longipes BDJ]
MKILGYRVIGKNDIHSIEDRNRQLFPSSTKQVLIKQSNTLDSRNLSWAGGLREEEWRERSTVKPTQEACVKIRAVQSLRFDDARFAPNEDDMGILVAHIWCVCLSDINKVSMNDKINEAIAGDLSEMHNIPMINSSPMNMHLPTRAQGTTQGVLNWAECSPHWPTIHPQG